MRSQAWEWAEGAGLTPTQGEILVLLMQRKGPMRLGEIARETALTAATTSHESARSKPKGLFEKRRPSTTAAPLGPPDGGGCRRRSAPRSGRTSGPRRWHAARRRAGCVLSHAARDRSSAGSARHDSAAPHVPELHALEPSKNPKKTPHYRPLLDLNMSDTDLRLDCWCMRRPTSPPRRRPGRSSPNKAASSGTSATLPSRLRQAA